jgi:hypothetical protein
MILNVSINITNYILILEQNIKIKSNIKQNDKNRNHIANGKTTIDSKDIEFLKLT